MSSERLGPGPSELATVGLRLNADDGQYERFSIYYSIDPKQGDRILESLSESVRINIVVQYKRTTTPIFKIFNRATPTS